MVCLLYTHKSFPVLTINFLLFGKFMVCFSSQLIAHTSHKLPGTMLGHYDRPSVDLCGHFPLKWTEIDRWPPHTACWSRVTIFSHTRPSQNKN